MCVWGGYIDEVVGLRQIIEFEGGMNRVPRPLDIIPVRGGHCFLTPSPQTIAAAAKTKTKTTNADADASISKFLIVKI
jgi:hypothetical protein